MAVEIRLPGLGESIAEGTIVAWLKAEGDVVARDEDLVVVSTDKVETELPSPAAGTLLKIVAAEGETIDVGATIAVLGEAGEVFTLSKPKAAKPVVVAKAPRVATPRATPPLQNTLSDPDQRNAAVRRTGDPKLFVSPAVRRIAREQDVDLAAVAGSGRGGRITRRDIETFIAEGGAGTGFAAPPDGYQIGGRIPWGGFAHRTVSPFEPGTPARYEPEIHEGDVVEKLPRSARAMAEHMAFTWWRAPHVSTLIEVDMEKIAQRRKATQGGFIKEHGHKLSYTACLGWATALTLAEHKTFNSSLASGYRRVTHRDVNLGVAVARPGGGLVVPVIRGADRLTLTEFAAALEGKIEAARDGKLTAADLRGGTFTITNVGSNGNLASMPLINQPQVAIVALGAIKKRVVVTTDARGHDAMAIRPMMYLTLTYDHRANDGAASGRFLRRLRKRMEQWNPGESPA